MSSCVWSHSIFTGRQRRHEMKRRRAVTRWADVPYGYMYGFPPHVTVARSKSEARRLARLRKAGRPVAPVVIEGRRIAKTFWGTSWCDNLERYGDFANRLPRGRSYVRNGAVVDLQVTRGLVTAQVSGSTCMTCAWPSRRCRFPGGSPSVSTCLEPLTQSIELLQGRLSDHVMSRLSTGLFPSPGEIRFDCTCPDGAFMCKHVAAALSGVGARLESRARSALPPAPGEGGQSCRKGRGGRRRVSRLRTRRGSRHSPHR